jgi:hypothetical protein
LKRRALLAGALAVLILFVPLTVGYAQLQQKSWQQMAAASVHPAPHYYAPSPLQAPRIAILALFAVDVGMWVALFLLVPLEQTPGHVFTTARRRLRRRWLYAHAPVISVVAMLTGARLHGLSLSSSGAGAAWFDPRLIATGHGFAPEVWSRGESLLLTSLAACFIVHISLLSGIGRAWHWLRNLLAAGLAAAALTALGTFVVLPRADGGLMRAAQQARAASAEACTAISQLTPVERAGEIFSAFARTGQASPAFQGAPYDELPETLAALPPLDFLLGPGVVVRWDGGAASTGLLRGGGELRMGADGAVFEQPSSPLCADARVLKIDRSILWPAVRALLAELEDGPLHLAYRPAPHASPRALPAPPGPRLTVVGAAGASFGSESCHALPLRPADGTASFASEPRNRLAPRGAHPDAFARTLPPRVAAPSPDPEGRTCLIASAETPWDDVLRAIAAAAASGSEEIVVATSP